MPDTFDPARILLEAQENIGVFVDSQSWWRSYEVRENYGVYAGHQWEQKTYNRRVEDGLPIHTINKSAPVIDAVAGFEAQHQAEIEYIPRRVSDPQAKAGVDMMTAVAKYVREDARINYRNSECFNDMLLCGLGASELYISFDDNLSGEIESRRIYPWLVGWDTAAQEKNFTDGNYAFYAHIVDERTAQELIDTAEDATSLGGMSAGAGGIGTYDHEFLQLYDDIFLRRKLVVVYSYHWREKQTFWRIENPFIERPGQPSQMLSNPLIGNYAMALAETHEFDIVHDQYINVTSKRALGDIRKGFEFLGLPLEYAQSQRWRYYRCKITGDHVIDPSESFSQDGHAIQFMVGKFDEFKRCPYGIMRALKDPQRLYNSAISDIQANIESSPNGGVIIESDATEDMAGFVDTYRKMRDITIVKPNALAGNKVMPKPVSQLNQSVSQMAMNMAADIPGVTGVTPAMMGESGDGRDVSGIMYAREVRQALYTLSAYFKARSFFAKQQGRQMIAAIRALAENMPYRPIYNMTGKQEAGQFLELAPDELAEEYEIIIKEVPVSPDEQADVAKKLIELAGQMIAAGRDPMPLMPLIVPKIGIPEEDQQAALQAMQPPPPTPPDENAVRLVQSQAADLAASAQKKAAEATKIQLESLATQIELQNKERLDSAALAETVSKAELNKAKTVDTLRGRDYVNA